MRVDDGQARCSYFELISGDGSMCKVAKTNDRRPTTTSELYDVQPLFKETDIHTEENRGYIDIS